MATPANAKYKKEQRMYRRRVKSSIVYSADPDQVIQTQDGRLYRQKLNGVLIYEGHVNLYTPGWREDPIGAMRARAMNFIHGLPIAKGQRVIIRQAEFLNTGRTERRRLERYKRLELKALFRRENIIKNNLSNALRYSRVLHGKAFLNSIRWKYSKYLAEAEKIRLRVMERKGIEVKA